MSRYITLCIPIRQSLDLHILFSQTQISFYNFFPLIIITVKSQISFYSFCNLPKSLGIKLFNLFMEISIWVKFRDSNRRRRWQDLKGFSTITARHRLLFRPAIAARLVSGIIRLQQLVTAAVPAGDRPARLVSGIIRLHVSDLSQSVYISSFFLRWSSIYRD